MCVTVSICSKLGRYFMMYFVTKGRTIDKSNELVIKPSLPLNTLLPYACIFMVQLNSNLTLAYMSLTSSYILHFSK